MFACCSHRSPARGLIADAPAESTTAREAVHWAGGHKVVMIVGSAGLFWGAIALTLIRILG